MYLLLSLLGLYVLIGVLHTAVDQLDLKRCIAYTTFIQMSLSLMFVLLHVDLCHLYLLVHAIYMSSLFLMVGLIVHESSSQDLRMSITVSMSLVFFGLLDLRIPWFYSFSRYL